MVHGRAAAEALALARGTEHCAWVEGFAGRDRCRAHNATAQVREPETATGLLYETVTKVGCLAPVGDSFDGEVVVGADAPEGNSRGTAGADGCNADKIMDFKCTE